ncbi:MAG: hypothetical protein EOO88_34930 [Pedobacter sp.]|nr:MAG: hypothetical protein EOO88_34930 [Pedobacter sp.]
MKQISTLLFLCFFVLLGCGPNGQEKSLKERQNLAAQKEQELLAWEQQLKMKEIELENTKQVLDSAKKQIDSASTVNPDIVGKWVVKMTCTETNCEGSALGDTKTEQWEISYEGTTVLVKAYSGLVLTRVYTGKYKDNVLSIVDEKPNNDATFSATLKFIDNKRMDGTREVLQKTCKIVYALNIQRSK